MTPEVIEFQAQVYNMGIFWIIGVILMMIMMHEIDKNEVRGERKMGFSFSLFMSVILGLVVGYIYLVYKVFMVFEKLWAKSTQR